MLSADSVRCCVLIAVKRRSHCKSRLRSVLNNAQRLALVRAMLSQVIAAATGASTVDRVFVVSPERDQIPRSITVLGDTAMGLNAALTFAQQELLVRGYDEVAVLPADLPHVQACDIDRLVHAGRRTGFALAPDSAGSGTNALFLRTEQPFRFQFGCASSHAHRMEAQLLSLEPEIVRAPRLEFDLDKPEDLRRLERHCWNLPCLA